MIYTFIYIVIGIILMGIIERVFPRQFFPNKKGWLLRACAINILQLVIVVLGHFTWENWIVGDHSLFKISYLFSCSSFIEGFFGYIFNTWVFYWWHRIRHESKACWLIFHQFHHSPETIEVITSFYKHPFEIAMNSVIITFVMYPILGLSVEAVAWMTLISAFTEYFYHANIKTPFWLGYFFQRPESHCLHHLRDKRYCMNYADIPLWDMLGGTFHNPTEDEVIETGFSDNKEENVKELIMCKDVLKKPMKNRSIFRVFIFSILVIFGFLNTFGHINNIAIVKGIAFATTASPLPLVFSVYNGVETFSTNFELELIFHNDTRINKKIDNKLYGNLKGPYNRRNMYGVIFSHGPFFNNENTLKMREQILTYGLCEPGDLAKEFGIMDKLKHVRIMIRSGTAGNEDQMWEICLTCISL